MATKKFTYPSIKVQQTPSAPPFYMMSCDASDLLKWSDVPRKKETFMAGYQRELDDRHQKIKEFFETDSTRNIIPNAVIVAVRPDAVTITQVENKPLWNIELTVADQSFDDALTQVISSFRARLSADELASIQEMQDGQQDEGDEDEEESAPPPSYLATIVQQLEAAKNDFESLDPPFREAVREYVLGVSKPGLIIDGQHRVFGAKNVSQFAVNLPVILLPGVDHQEQVFHFYVLNNKAKPLNKTELRTIVSTSLGKDEISALYDRFKQVGVTAEQTEWTYRMNTSEASPFRNLINFGLPGSSGIIPENVAYQLVSRFLNLNRKYKLLIKDVAPWNATDSSKWDYRLNCFFALWRAVKAKYPTAWQQAISGGPKQILQKVSLLVLQEYLLDNLNSEMPKRSARGEPSPFDPSQNLEEEIGFALEFLKEEFFVKEWKLRGLDTSRGHDEFRRAIQDAIAAQSANLGNMKLFRNAS